MAIQSTTLKEELTWLLDQTIAHKASDLHVLAGVSPTIRIDGELRQLDKPAYTPASVNELLLSLIGKAVGDKIASDRKEIDFAFTYQDHRFRANVFYTTGVLAGSFRLLPNTIQTLDQLGVLPQVADLLNRKQGIIMVVGPTGHGKSTTLASMVNTISESRREHIITIEDPIEYVFENRKSIISQREVGSDTPSFAYALRSALREDPDVVMVGEMRDLETVDAAFQMAETGHLVLSSLHTNSAAQTTERIIGMYNQERQSLVRQQLADTLVAIVSQRLLPKVNGGRVLAMELLIATPAVRTIIREGKTHQLGNIIQTSAADGMVLLERSLADLVSKGEVAIDEATNWAIDPKNLKLMVY
jgi:twitching motility protein PilT